MRMHMSVYVNNSGTDTWFLFLLLLVALQVVLWLRKRSIPYLVCCFLFGLYLMYALDRTFFPLFVSGVYVDDMRQIPVLSFVNLNPFFVGPADMNTDPFNLGRSSSLTIALPGLLLNVLLTIPFGFGINFVRQIKSTHILWLALGVGLTIEGAQLLLTLLLQYPFREVDINDVLMNAIGVLIGYGMFRGFA